MITEFQPFKNKKLKKESDFLLNYDLVKNGECFFSNEEIRQDIMMKSNLFAIGVSFVGHL
ncbi:hypothetical protein T10_1495 [Trichinella papuae]|uniref:Uncharacterized protein n=1 Tax=Trichinella papuae TaxID=268474 RepID=A0A0V1MR37_9BILA|nr:hypothetical protein T10_1495 [Trichinella papuae]